MFLCNLSELQLTQFFAYIYRNNRESRLLYEIEALLSSIKEDAIEYLYNMVMRAWEQNLLPNRVESITDLFTSDQGKVLIRSLIKEGVEEGFAHWLQQHRAIKETVLREVQLNNQENDEDNGIPLDKRRKFNDDTDAVVLEQL